MNDRRDQVLEKLLPRLKEALATVDFRQARSLLEQSVVKVPDRSSPDRTRLAINSIASDIYDYFGDQAQSASWVRFDAPQCQRRLEDLQKGIGLQRSSMYFKGQRSECKAYIVLLMRDGYVKYRNHLYREALDTWDFCLKVLESRIASDDYPCQGTFGRLYYACGLAYRQMGHAYYERAKQCFTNAVDFAAKDADARPAGGRALSDYRIAKCLGLGLGWIFYTEGQLNIARSLIQSAQALVSSRKQESMIVTYIRVIQACVDMSEYGSNQTKVKKAIELLKECHATFKGAGHDGYRIRAANELAHAYLRLTRFDISDQEAIAKVREYASEVLDYAEPRTDNRWIGNACIVLTRMERQIGDLPAAEAHAKKAREAGQGIPFIKTDALIAIGELKQAEGEVLVGKKQMSAAEKAFSDAAASFKEALDLGKNNAKVAAVCHLHLVNVYLMLSDFAKAFYHREQWRVLSPQIQNSFILRLGDATESRMIEKRGDFNIPFSTPILKSKDVHSDLHKFLVRWAMSRVSTNKEAADLLGIAVNTFNNWRGDKSDGREGEEKPRARAKGAGGPA